MRKDVESICAVELLFESAPEIPVDALVEALKRACPGIDPMGEPGEMLAFAHTSHVVQYKDGAFPAQLVIFPGGRKGDRTSIDDAVQQSWNLPEAKEVVASSTHGVLVTDMMAQGLPNKERISVPGCARSDRHHGAVPRDPLAPEPAGRNLRLLSRRQAKSGPAYAPRRSIEREVL